MPGTLTDITIANRSLVRLGSGTINSFEDGNDKANIIASQYPAVRDALLTSYPWRFAMKTRELARTDDDPERWQYSFQLPSDMLSGPEAVYRDDSPHSRPFTMYDKYGDRLVANERRIWIDYKFRPPESEWPPYFTELMVLALCAAIAPGITDQTSTAELYMVRAYGTPQENMRGGYFSVATREDAKNQPMRAMEDYSLINARLS